MKGRKPIQNEARETLSVRVSPSTKRQYQLLRSRGMEAYEIADYIAEEIALLTLD